MNYFRIGVSVPVPNFRFKQPHRWSSTFDTAAAISTTTLLPELYTPQYSESSLNCDKFLQNGDKITLGPSTNSSYAGKTEVVTIRSISGNTITTEEEITNAYAVGDSLSGEGSLCPQGWFPNYNLIMPKGIYHPDGGKSDDYAMKLYFAGADQVPWVKCPFNYLPFKENLWYEVGCYYRSDKVRLNETELAPHGALIGVHDGVINTEAWMASTTENLNTLAWTAHGHTFNTQPDCRTNYTSQPHIRTVMGFYGANGKMTLWLDDFYIQHSDPTDVKTEIVETGALVTTASGIGGSLRVMSTTDFSVGDTVLISGYHNSPATTIMRTSGHLRNDVADGDPVNMNGVITAINTDSSTIEIAPFQAIWIKAGGTLRKLGNCYYQFTEHAEDGSVQIQKASQFKHSFKAGKLIGNCAYGDASKLEAFKVQMSFAQASVTFLEDLKKYIRAQEQGNYLIFHLRDNLPQIPHPFLIGFMEINGERFDFWDNNYVSFNLTFTGF